MGKIIKVVVHYEPNRKHSGKNDKIVRTEKAAIEMTKTTALKHSNFIYPNDEEALLDYMAIHWANKETRELEHNEVLK